MTLQRKKKVTIVNTKTVGDGTGIAHLAEKAEPKSEFLGSPSLWSSVARCKECGDEYEDDDDLCDCGTCELCVSCCECLIG